MSTNRRRQVIYREGNIVLVDFGREPEPPAPRFPGADGLRQMRFEDCQLGLGPIAVNDAA